MPIYLGNKKISYQQHVDYNKGSGDTPSSTEKKVVNFYDYDGTLLHSYTREEALRLSELPSLPNRSSEGLTCQGWNWALENIKTELTNREDLNYLAVCATYITTDGATHINITMADKYRNQMPLVFVGDVTIDWGDGVTESANHTTATTITHEYATAQSYPAKYTIKLTVNSGTLTFGDGSFTYNICGSASQSSSNPVRIYSSRIDSVFIGNGVSSIGICAFYACFSLASITIPNSVRSIGTDAFNSCFSLASISIPNSVTSIGSYAFSSCFSLASITIPNGVTNIYIGTFNNCYSLASVTIPNSVISIGDSAFNSCRTLASISIPDSLTSSIGNSAFNGCRTFASITIPNGVTSININAFNGCSGIIKYDFSTHTVVPTLANTNAFSGIASDAKIVVPDALYATWIAATNWATYANYIVKASEYREPGDPPLHTIITYTDDTTTEIEDVDDGVLTVTMTKGAGNEYTENTTIQSVEIGKDVTSIGETAFLGCLSLTSVTISEGVTEIGYGAFAACTSLTSVTIPEGVTSIEEEAFAYCVSLTSITIPSSVSYIGSQVFSDCTSLPKDESGVQYESTEKVVLIDVPESLTGEFIIPDSVRFIHSNAFWGCTSLTSIVISEEVTSIGDYAFENCTGLTSITIPSSVTYIGNFAFSNCTGLTSITIPEGVTSIRDYTFATCQSLTSITIPSTVTSIGKSVFDRCTSLTSVTIPEGVTELGESVFSNCSGLTSVTIPEGVTEIGRSAFWYCRGLTSVTIPSSVTSIGDSAFSGCSSLDDITFDKTMEEVSAMANYPWSITTGTIINCTDGELTVA